MWFRCISRQASSIKTNSKLYALHHDNDATQFSKGRLVNHGELENGEVPEALKYSRPVQLTQLSNGIRVVTDSWPGPISTVGIMIEAGSRNETIHNTGTAHFCEHLHFKGTNKRNRTQLESEIENIGGNLNAYTSRETTLYQMQVYKGLEERALDIISDMLLNSRYDRSSVESEREVILREEEEVMGDTKELILENVHYTAFRDHIIGQPILGNKKSIRAIQREDLKKFIYSHYVGPRMVVVGVGPVEHSKIVDLAEKYLGKVPTKTEIEIIGEDTPLFTGSQIQIRDDDVEMTHMGIFYPAPSWRHKDYFAFLVLQRLMGDYDPSRDAMINHPHLQYNFLHKFLGEMEDVGKHECLYLPYKDCGLIGHYVSSLDLSAALPPSFCLRAMRRATDYIMESELFRARNKLYNELLNTESGEEVSQTLASQLIYMGRVIPRTEIAKRIASMDSRYLEKVFANWLWESELALAFYGPTFMVARNYGIYRSYTGNSNLSGM